MSEQDRPVVYEILAFNFADQDAASQAARKIEISGALQGRDIVAQAVVVEVVMHGLGGAEIRHLCLHLLLSVGGQFLLGELCLVAQFLRPFEGQHGVVGPIAL